jgi:hypothetical protein
MKAIEVFGRAMLESTLLVAAIPLGVIIFASATVEDELKGGKRDRSIFNEYFEVIQNDVDKIFFNS